MGSLPQYLNLHQIRILLLMEKKRVARGAESARAPARRSTIKVVSPRPFTSGRATPTPHFLEI